MHMFFLGCTMMIENSYKEHMPMFSYDEIKERPELLLAMTSLTKSEFEQLLPDFQQAWDQYIQESYVRRAGRQRQYGGGKSETTLVTIGYKLLFILYYFKAYPLQEIIAYSFGMTQSTANDWIQVLTEVLKNALDKGKHLPERDPKILEDVLKANAEDEYGIDGTERRIVRPKDDEVQRYYYSGKKKTHTVKNIIIGGITEQKVNYLSQTYEGKKHDKGIVDDEAPAIPEGVSLYKDTGFQGYEPEGVITFQPLKKPRGKELTPEQKEENRLISKVRVMIEHVISGVKRCRIVKDIFRNTITDYEDIVMEIACGLHNFRVDCRKAYSR